MQKKKIIISLLLITLIGLCLRFYKLGEVPVGFHQDEAFLTYNGYAILKTGKDITNNFLPLDLNSFFYSPAGYSYLSIPWIFLFGLSSFSARFASAFFGMLTIPLVYMFVREFFAKYKYKDLLGLLSAFLLAISPWHINLSRTATENIPVVFFITLAVYLYLLYCKKGNILCLFFSFVAFFFTLFTYQAPRSFLPLFIPFMVFYFFYTYRKTCTKFNIIVVSALYIVVIIAPVLFVLSSPTLSTRMKELSIFHAPLTQLLLNESIREDGMQKTPIYVSRIFHNKIAAYTTTFIDNYFSHFSFDFLFTDNGLPERYRVPSMGLLYLFELPLLLFAFIVLSRNLNREGLFLIGWVLLAPVGSALTFDAVPNLQRTVIMYPALAILSAYGLMQLYLLSRKWRISQMLFSPLVTLIFLGSISVYLHQYYVNQIAHKPLYRYEGSQETAVFVHDLLQTNKFDQAIIANPNTLPPINLLFFTRYDPATFERENGTNPSVNYVSFGKYAFVSGDCPIPTKKRILYVGNGTCYTDDTMIILKTVTRSDGVTVFTIATEK